MLVHTVDKVFDSDQLNLWKFSVWVAAIALSSSYLINDPGQALTFSLGILIYRSEYV
jgi:hypothetical protein